MMPTPSVVFLDRDGTIIRDASYLSRAQDVELLPHAARAIARLNALNVPVIVITNQSGIARGMFTVEQYHETQRRLDDLLAASGARIDATYYCPDHPDFGAGSGCRKPSVQLFERAASDHSLNMTSPAFVGDRWRDIEMYHSLGGTPILISGPNTPPTDSERATSEHVAIVKALAEAVDLLLGADRL
jgi:D-glycero-D-manno-heptose 1,7-bisphosphate phosphatase